MKAVGKCLKQARRPVKLLEMEGEAGAGVKLSTLKRGKRFHNLCGIRFMENLNGHGGCGC